MKILIRLVIVAVVILVVIGIATSGKDSTITPDATDVTPLENAGDGEVSDPDMTEEDELEALIDAEISEGIVILGGDGIPNN